MTSQAASTDTIISLQDANGIGIAGVEIKAFANGTQVRIKTDSKGVAALPELKGAGSLEINHCIQSATSIALQIYDVDYGVGGKSVTIKLPSRASVFEYQLQTSDGVKLQKSEQISYLSTPLVESWMEDYGTFSTPLGEGEISSCGSAWLTSETLRVAPFSSSQEGPKVTFIEDIPGGTTERKYSTSDFVAGQTKTITVANFKYVEVTSRSKTVYQKQLTRFTAKIMGVSSTSDLFPAQPFALVCDLKSKPGLKDTRGDVATLDKNLTVIPTITFQDPGLHRCFVSDMRSGTLGSFAFDVKVLTERQFKLDVGKKFKSCTALNLVFEGGVASSSKSQKADKKAKNLPVLSLAGYKLNSNLDRDKDGVACED